MKRITKFRYTVANQESVTFTVTPISVGPRVVATNNGATIPDTGSAGTPVFSFTVDQVPGNSHFVILECSFLAGDPDEARFDLVLKGSKGGTFKDIVVKKTHAVWDPQFRFTVT